MSSFLTMTRGERFPCSVLMHVLLTPSPSQQAVIDLFNTRVGEPLLQSDRLEVYNEIGLLRDAWARLGDHKKYNDALDQRRYAFVHQLLTRLIDFTGGPEDLKAVFTRYPDAFLSATGKLLSPGRWNLTTASLHPDFRDHDIFEMNQLKLAFNAIPDLLFHSGRRAIMVEAKALSPAGSNKKKDYEQAHTQKAIARLAPVILPDLFDTELKLVLLANKPDKNTETWRTFVSWSEVASQVSSGDVGQFSKAALYEASQLTY